MEQKFADKIRYKVVELSDNEESDIRKHFRECIQFLDEDLILARLHHEVIVDNVKETVPVYK